MHEPEWGSIGWCCRRSAVAGHTWCPCWNYAVTRNLQTLIHNLSAIKTGLQREYSESDFTNFANSRIYQLIARTLAVLDHLLLLVSRLRRKVQFFGAIRQAGK
jgi:hypothetical protein